MKQPNWNRIQEIYHAALARPHSERNVFVANACSAISIYSARLIRSSGRRSQQMVFWNHLLSIWVLHRRTS